MVLILHALRLLVTQAQILFGVISIVTIKEKHGKEKENSNR